MLWLILLRSSSLITRNDDRLILVHVLILKAVLTHLQALTRSTERWWRLHPDALILTLERLHVISFIFILILWLTAIMISRVTATIRQIIMHYLPTLPLLLTIRPSLSNRSFNNATLIEIVVHLWRTTFEALYSVPLRVLHINLKILNLITDRLLVIVNWVQSLHPTSQRL